MAKIKFTTEEFIKKAIEIHGNKFDYSKFKYLGCDKESIIICKKHNEVPILPTKHLSGESCAKCVGRNKTLEEFINEANEIHKFKYKYSKFAYINWKTKGIIICAEHGEFSQSPNKHLKRKRGCPKCGGKLRKTTKEFIDRANEIHEFLYDYSKVNYINKDTYVEIICEEHGSFFQSPNSHIHQEAGCIICAGTYQFDTEEFIKRSKLTHGLKYDYSKSIYINCKEDVIINCFHHGDFSQIAMHHMRGSGCKKCNVTGGYSFTFFNKNPHRKNDISNLYLLKFTSVENNEIFYKIGISKKQIKQRFSSELKFYNITKIFSFEGKLYPIFCLEQRLHKYVSNTQQRPTITKLIGGTGECFYCNDEYYLKYLIEYIRSSNEFIS